MSYTTDELPAVGADIAVDRISGSDFQRVKVAHGAEGSATDASATSPMPVQEGIDAEVGIAPGRTSLRDNLIAQRHTVLADSLADGLAGFWTSATANGGTATSSGGEGLLQTSANATGSAQITSTTVNYLPGMVAWLNSACRFNDTGSAGNIRRIGAYTVSGTTPQNGFYYELNGTTLNAVVVTGATPTTVAATSWSKFSTAPFTLDTNYHSFEIRFTANSALFYIDNVLRHVHTGTTAAITATLNFPITIVSVNTSGATNRLIAVRNVGMGRFGNAARDVEETGLSAVHAMAVGGGTPHDSVDSGSPLKLGARAIAHGANPTAVAAADRTHLYANRHGIPFTIGGHPNIVTLRATYAASAQTNAAIVSVSAGTKIVVTQIQVAVSNSTTNTPLVRIGFATATTPTTTGVLFSHPGIPGGGAPSRGDGSGIIGVGADDEDVRITSDSATSGTIDVVLSYFTVES